MENYELKFKKKQSDTILGIIWIFIGLVSLCIFFFFISKIRPSFTIRSIIAVVFFAFILLLNIILGFIMGKHCIMLSSKIYISINDKELQINKSLILKPQIIKFEDIDEVRLIGEKIVIILMNYCSDKEVEIWLNLMYLKDLDILLNNFSKNNKLVKRL